MKRAIVLDVVRGKQTEIGGITQCFLGMKAY